VTNLASETAQEQPGEAPERPSSRGGVNTTEANSSSGPHATLVWWRFFYFEESRSVYLHTRRHTDGAWITIDYFSCRRTSRANVHCITNMQRQRHNTATLPRILLSSEAIYLLRLKVDDDIYGDDHHDAPAKSAPDRVKLRMTTFCPAAHKKKATRCNDPRAV
jgi:hypothetical protein